MTKEELKQEAEEKCVCTDEAMRIMYGIGFIDGSEPREKRIAELERENAELKLRLKEIEESDSVTELKFLRNASKSAERDVRNAYKNGKLESMTQLTKAKEIIELFVQWNYGCCEIPDYKDLVKQAEQFLKEE